MGTRRTTALVTPARPICSCGAGGGWSQQAYLKASNTDGGDQFGQSVAVSGDTVVVGAIREDSNATGVDGDQSNNSINDAGAAYVFVRSGGGWSQQAYLKASNTDGGDLFGHSVAVSGDAVVVAAVLENSNATGVDGDQANNSPGDAGAAYMFGLGPSQVLIDIKPDGDPNSIIVNNRNKNGVIPVAILSDAGFDASSVDPSTV